MRPNNESEREQESIIIDNEYDNNNIRTNNTTEFTNRSNPPTFNYAERESPQIGMHRRPLAPIYLNQSRSTSNNPFPIQPLGDIYIHPNRQNDNAATFPYERTLSNNPNLTSREAGIPLRMYRFDENNNVIRDFNIPVHRGTLNYRGLELHISRHVPPPPPTDNANQYNNDQSLLPRFIPNISRQNEVHENDFNNESLSPRFIQNINRQNGVQEEESFNTNENDNITIHRSDPSLQTTTGQANRLRSISPNSIRRHNEAVEQRRNEINSISERRQRVNIYGDPILPEEQNTNNHFYFINSPVRMTELEPLENETNLTIDLSHIDDIIDPSNHNPNIHGRLNLFVNHPRNRSSDDDGRHTDTTVLRSDSEEEEEEEEEEGTSDSESNDSNDSPDFFELLNHRMQQRDTSPGYVDPFTLQSLPTFFNNNRRRLETSNRFREKNYTKKNDAIAEKVLNCLPNNIKNWSYDPLSFLAPGQTFKGSQNQFNSCFNRGDKEHWEVKVSIHSIDPSSSSIFGLMEALNTPVASSTVITYWEGEVIDFKNHTFWTNKWGADKLQDIEHWKRFDAYKDLKRTYKDPDAFTLVLDKYIFMRWKELYFVNILPSESGLTIAGFYYICIRRSDGFIEGFYCDPTSKPFQRLELYPVSKKGGHLFGEFTLA